MESFQVNDAVEVIDPETGRWTAAIITSLPSDSTVLVRYPGWGRKWSSGEVNLIDVREPTTLLRKRRRSRPENAVNLLKLERGDAVHLPFEGRVIVEIVDPFKKEVVVLLECGSRRTVDLGELQSSAPHEPRERSWKAAVQPPKKPKSPPSQAQTVPAQATPLPSVGPAPPAELDLVFTITTGGLVIRCGEAYQGSAIKLLVSRILLKPPTTIIVRGRKLLGDPPRVSNEVVEVAADQLERAKAFKCDATRTIKLEAIGRTQQSISVEHQDHLRFMRRNEVGLLVRTQVRALMTSKGRSGSFSLPFNFAFDGDLLPLETAFGLKCELATDELDILDGIAGQGWDFKPVDVKEESPGFFYFATRVLIAVDLSSLLMKFTVQYTKSQFNWGSAYRADCRNQLRQE